MAYIEDLTPYTYSDDDIVRVGDEYVSYRPRYDRLAIGWLEDGHEFPTGDVPPRFVDALFEALDRPRVNVMRGFQTCFRCPRQNGMVGADHRGRTTLLGNAEIRVPAGPSTMYAAPNLIWHYVTAHAYAPPEPFITAVESYDPSWAADPTHRWIPADAERD